RARVPGGLAHVRAADHGPGVFRPADRPLPLAPPVAVRRQQLVAPADRVRRRRPVRLLVRLLARTGLSPQGRTFIAREIWSRRWKFMGFILLSIVAAVIELTGVGLVFPLLLIIVAPEMIERIPPLVWVTETFGIGRGMGMTIFLIVTIAVLMTAKNA